MRILVVEDEPKAGDYLRKGLTESGFVVDLARTGPDGLQLASADAYDLIVLDAFTSDAIPLHLLTLEAVKVYLSRLAPDGLLLFHLSNRYLNLEPVVARSIAATDLIGLIRANLHPPQKDVDAGGNRSVWSTAARRQSLFGQLAANEGWRPLRIQPGVVLWTDDFSNIFKVFHLSGIRGVDRKAEPRR